MGFGKIKEVSAVMNMFKNDDLNYDESTIISVKSEHGLIGSIMLDVVTEPSQKNLRIQGSKGFIEWHVNYDADHDAVFYGKTGRKGNIQKSPVRCRRNCGGHYSAVPDW